MSGVIPGSLGAITRCNWQFIPVTALSMGFAGSLRSITYASLRSFPTPIFIIAIVPPPSVVSTVICFAGVLNNCLKCAYLSSFQKPAALTYPMGMISSGLFWVHLQELMPRSVAVTCWINRLTSCWFPRNRVAERVKLYSWVTNKRQCDGLHLFVVHE